MQSFSVSLSSKGLQNVNSQFGFESFAFVIGADNSSDFIDESADIYDVPSYLAEFISPNVAKLHSVDCGASNFFINIKDEKKSFRHIVDLMNGKTIEVNDLDAASLMFFAEKLGNLELYESLLSKSKENEPIKLTPENVVEILLNKYKATKISYFALISYKEEITFIAKHFNEIDVKELEKLPLALLETILSSDDLKVETEDHLFNFIRDLVSKHGKSYRILFEYLWFEFLDESAISKFVEMTTPEDINASIWSEISRRLMMNSKSKSKRLQIPSVSIQNSANEETTSEEMNEEANERLSEVGIKRFSKGTVPFKGEPFDGIISFIRKSESKAANENLDENDIKFRYLSGNPYCDKLFDYEWKGYWSTTKAPGQWLSFEFPEKMVYLTDYTLKTPNSKPGWNHLKNWVIEGRVNVRGNESNDDNGDDEWMILDERIDNFELNGNSKVATFHCSNPQRVNEIRIRATGKNHRNADDINLTNIEFFGRITKTNDFI